MSDRIRLVFMGTPTFAVPTLQRLIESPAYDIVGVVTQPDAPTGRGRSLAPSPVKRLALEHGLHVLQSERVRHPDSVAALRELQPDVFVVAAFGQILPRAVLDMAPFGALNVHASLLPRWRGAAPIPAAILAGDEQTGVTIMLLDEGMDTGPILAQAATPILPHDTTGSLTTRLAEMGARLLMETLPRWVRGEIRPQPQDDSRATLCRPITKENGRFDWQQTAVYLARAIRAYHPWPGAYTFWNDKLLKIVGAWAKQGPTPQPPGTVINTPDGPAVTTGDGLLVLAEVQLEGKRVLPIADFVRGQRGFIGSRLG